MTNKKSISDLALYGGDKLFPKPVSTSNLVRPDLNAFLSLLKPALDPEGEQQLLKELESELAEFHQCQFAITMCSGFWALVLAIKSLALPNKSEVVMPSLTYRRLADVVAWTGLKPHFCEVDTQSLAISAESAAPHISDQTALIIGVHPIVNSCDAPALEALAHNHQLPILFDGVESVYESVEGKKIGSFGDAECFSFHASKLINGFEGGYVTTNSEKLADQLRQLRLGSNGGMEATLPPVHAAMALQGLREIDQQISHNQSIYRHYQQYLLEFDGLRLLEFDEKQPTSFKNIVVEITESWPLPRSITLSLLNAEGVLSRAYYYPALHQKNMAYPAVVKPLPFTEMAAEQYMLMPCGYQVQTGDVDKVIGLLEWLKIHHKEILTKHEGAQ